MINNSPSPRIVGLDVGAGIAVPALLNEFPPNIKRHFAEHRRSFVRLKSDADGFKYLENLNPDGIVLEPTGGHYSRCWADWAKSNDIPLYWVGHADLAAQRKSYGFQNKRDDEDALCLAACYFDDRFVDEHGAKRFLKFEDGSLGALREKLLMVEQLDKLYTQSVNQVRQRLAHEFPEIAKSHTFVSKQLGFSPLWGWLAGTHKHPKMDKRYKESCVRSFGLGISEYTRQHAAAIVSFQTRKTEIQAEIEAILSLPEFAPYLAVLEDYGFSETMRPLMLTQVLPFEQFLLNGKPYIDWEESLNGKLQRRDRSLRSFQAYLGLAYTLRQSGNKLSKSFLGSDLVRSHLYIWLVSRMRGKGRELNIPEPKRAVFEAKLQTLADGGVTGADKLIRLLFYITRHLWKDLLKAYR